MRRSDQGNRHKNNSNKSEKGHPAKTPEIKTEIINQEQDDNKKEEEYVKELKSLWQMILKANPEKRENIISKLDKKTVVALRTYNNPYKKPIIEGDRNRYLAFNFINMTEKYCQRFAMT